MDYKCRSQIESGREREDTRVYMLEQEDENFIEKKYLDEEKFRRAVTSLNVFSNIEYTPDLIELNPDENSIIMPFYKDYRLDWGDRDMVMNFLSSLSDFFREIHSSEYPGTVLHNSDYYIDKFERTSVESVNMYSFYEDKIRELCSELRNYNLDIVPCHRDSHLSNYILNQDGSICKVIDWELSGYFPRAYDIAKVYSRILTLYNCFSEIDLPSSFFDLWGEIDRKTKIWAAVYQMRTTGKTNSRGHVQEDALRLFGDEESLLKKNEELSEVMYNSLDF